MLDTEYSSLARGDCSYCFPGHSLGFIPLHSRYLGDVGMLLVVVSSNLSLDSQVLIVSSLGLPTCRRRKSANPRGVTIRMFAG